jgi:hypothetical protein
MPDDEFKWNKCDVNTAKCLLAGTDFPGQVFSLDVTGLPPGIQKLPGIKEAYISGLMNPIEVLPSLTGLGEFVAVRYEGTTGKAYNWGFAQSGDGSVLFIGPFKYFEGHHFESGKAVPVEKIFTHSILSIKPTTP